MEVLADQFGRVVRDVRMSVTDRCDFSCTYCTPVPVDNSPRNDLLRVDELARIAGLLIEVFGVTAIRLTGGEPTVRRDLVEVVGSIAALGRGDLDLSMTTHGAHLAKLAEPLRAAGLSRVNVSLDTLDPIRFKAITGRPRLDDVVGGVEAARRAGLGVKINAVLEPGPTVRDDVLGLAEFGAAAGVVVRFIEYMPLDSGGEWAPEKVVTAERIRGVLVAHGWELGPPTRATPSAPAAQFEATRNSQRVRLGIIASVSEPFCSACDRLRVSADGALRSCLFSQEETDLRRLLRADASDEELAAVIRDVVWNKPAAHGVGTPAFIRPSRPMSRIGG